LYVFNCFEGVCSSRDVFCGVADTAFIASRGNWLYCDDSRVTQANAKEVVGKPAYVLYYKRVKP